VALSSAQIRPIDLRRLEEGDWPQVHEIVVEVASAGETYAMDVPASVEETREFWSGQHVVVAVEGETVLGSAKMGPNRPAQGAHVGTASFVVGGAARGRGVGRALAEHMVEWHRATGFRGIQFNAVVSTNTSAVRLWQSLGFETIGRVPGAFRLPDGEYVDLLVMYLPLVPASAPDRTV
jgi:L-amino acid N-acyltransferase YncA